MLSCFGGRAGRKRGQEGLPLGSAGCRGAGRCLRKGWARGPGCVLSCLRGKAQRDRAPEHPARQAGCRHRSQHP